MIARDRLREMFFYDPIVGVFVRKVRASANAKVGDIAGSKDKLGYLTIRADGKSYKVHSLAWLYTHGERPSEDIDHINRNIRDNAILNLRLATDSENLRNTTVRPDCAAGLKGVHVHRVKGKPTGLFRVRVRVNGVRHEVGYFPSAASAHAAYAESRSELHGEFARAA